MHAGHLRFLDHAVTYSATAFERGPQCGFAQSSAVLNPPFAQQLRIGAGSTRRSPTGTWTNASDPPAKAQTSPAEKCRRGKSPRTTSRSTSSRAARSNDTSSCPSPPTGGQDSEEICRPEFARLTVRGKRADLRTRSARARRAVITETRKILQFADEISLTRARIPHPSSTLRLSFPRTLVLSR